jgi:hypothetical protein
MARTFVFSTNENNGVCQIGIVKYTQLNEDIPKEEGWFEITDSEAILEVNSFPEKFFVETGDFYIQRKKEVVIRVKKRIFESDGQDAAEVEFDLPEDVNEVEIEVSGAVLGKFKQKIKKEQPLKITSDVMDVIRVKVKDSKLYADDRTSYVLARRKGRRGILEIESAQEGLEGKL